MADDADSAASLDLLLRENDVLRRILTFARRHGEPHATLAMHAALPLGLTPDLLHLIRVNFVARAPWIAEADLLLSPLCREVGGELYEMDARVREELLDHLSNDPEFGPPRVRQVAEFLREYAARSLVAVEPGLRDFFEAQEWVGLAYARPEEAARALAAALGARMSEDDAPGVGRVVRMTQALTAPLYTEDGVLMYAAAVGKLGEGDAAGARRLFAVLGPADESPDIGGVRLPPPAELLRRTTPAETSDGEPTGRTQEDEETRGNVTPHEEIRREKSHEDFDATPSSNGWTGDDWEGLILSIKHEMLTPVVGPGVAAGLLPLGRELARELAARFRYPWTDYYDLPRVAQFIAVEHGADLFVKYLMDRLSGVGPNLHDPENVYANLARLPLPIYVTTAFDDYLMEALRRHGKRPVRQVCGWRPRTRRRRPPAANYDYSPTSAEPLVFHLYGHPDEPESLVLTADDYLDWLLSVSENYDSIPPRVQESFASSSLLFAGFDVRDTGFRVLQQYLRPYIRQGEGMRHVFTQSVPSVPRGATEDEQPREERASQYFQLYLDLNRLKVFWGTSAEFFRELNRRRKDHPDRAPV